MARPNRLFLRRGGGRWGGFAHREPGDVSVISVALWGDHLLWRRRTGFFFAGAGGGGAGWGMGRAAISSTRWPSAAICFCWASDAARNALRLATSLRRSLSSSDESATVASASASVLGYC